MVVYSKPSYRYNNWSNRYINHWDIGCDFQDTIQDKPFFSDKRNNKNEQKAQRIANHHEQIFNICGDWTNQQFSIDVRLTQFDLDNLYIDIVEQIVPVNNSNNTNLIRLEERAASHLNCADYIDAYNKFVEIRDLQNNFNVAIMQFMTNHRNDLIQILNSDTNQDGSINRLLRYLFHKAVMFNAQPEGVSVQLDDFRSTLVDPLDTSSNLSNPFPDKQDELIDYLQKNYNDIMESINNFQTIIGNIGNVVREFQEMLEPIIHNRLDGLKGNCSIETPSSSIGKIRPFFNRYKHFVSK
jgi:hypothetical protein